MQIDDEFARLARDILVRGELRDSRAGPVRGLFGLSFSYDMQADGFPIMQSRKIPYKSASGELAAFLKKPTKVSDFMDRDCKYWNEFADEKGNLTLDYGNAWLDYNGVDQLRTLIRTIKDDPTNRRLIINGWRPDRLAELSLPCCHTFYQFYVREGKYLDMNWYQRSADLALGVSVDFVTAGLFLTLIANATNLVEGKINFMFGDIHIYNEHYIELNRQLEIIDTSVFESLQYQLTTLPGTDPCTFEKEDFILYDYKPVSRIKYKLLT